MDIQTFKRKNFHPILSSSPCNSRNQRKKEVLLQSLVPTYYSLIISSIPQIWIHPTSIHYLCLCFVLTFHLVSRLDTLFWPQMPWTLILCLKTSKAVLYTTEGVWITSTRSQTLRSLQNVYIIHAHWAQSCPTLWDLMGYSLPSSSVHGIFQARILEWVAISLSSRSSWPRDWTQVSWVSWIGRWILYQCAAWEAHIVHNFTYFKGDKVFTY